MALLGVNIDHIATLRQQRLIGVPEIASAAKTAIKHGADSVTVHLREDRRHIQDKDVFELRKIKNLKLNLEMAVSEEIVKVALKARPYSACLVPENRRELTTEGGLDILSALRKIKGVIDTLKSKGITVSVFLDPSPEQIKAAYHAGADAVEIHTGAYAEAKSKSAQIRELNRILDASSVVRELGMRLHAGHGLDYENVKPIASIIAMRELNIGFSIIARSVFDGLGKAVADMKKLVS